MLKSQERQLARLAEAMTAEGLILMSGVPMLEEHAQELNLTVLIAEPVHQLPTFRLHRAILENAQLYPNLMAYVLSK